MSDCQCCKRGYCEPHPCKPCIQEANKLGVDRTSGNHFVCECKCVGDLSESCLQVCRHLSPCWKCTIVTGIEVVAFSPLILLFYIVDLFRNDLSDDLEDEDTK